MSKQTAALDTRELERSLSGSLRRPGDPGYDLERSLNNAAIDRRPAVIVRCAGPHDVAAALRFARDHGLPVSVRGGGHGVMNHALADDGVAIDLTAMDTVSVDAARRVARVAGGATWGHVDPATQAFGLAVTGARVSTVGVGGFTLGSGSGWIERRYGLAPDNLLSAEVVTAAGETITASETEHPELFWGLRGGGGNFGVVTELEFRLHQLGPVLCAGMLLYPIARAHDVMRAWRDFMDAAPDEVSGAFGVITAPPEPFVPDELKGRPAAAITYVYTGPTEEGQRLVAPLERATGPAVDMVGPMPYLALQSLLDAASPPGRHNYWRSGALSALTDDAIDTLLDHAARVRSPFTLLLIEAKGGAIARVPEADTAIGARQAAYSFHGYAIWEEPGETDEHTAWARELAAAMGPFTLPGLPLNFSSQDDESEVARTYGDRYGRLQRVKDAYDPENVLRLNANVSPTG